MFGELLAWLQGLSHPMVLAVTGLLVLSETVVGPGVLVPGESGLLAASTTATTPARFLTLWGVVFSFAVIGDSAGYLLGRRYGDRLSALAPVRWLGGRSAWERASASLRRRGAWAVVLGRLVPVARTFTPAAAGCAHLQAHRFFPAAIGGALLWSLIHVLVGASLGRAAHRIEPLMNAGIWVILVALGTGGIAKLVRHRSKMKKTPERRPSPTTTEFPLANQCVDGRQLHIGPPMAPTRAGKTTTDQIPKALAAPGALWCSSSQRDMFLHTALARTRRPQAGPVQLLDATATVDFPAQAYWPPMTGCTDPEVADRRAGILVETSGSAGRAAQASSSGNEEFFREHTIMVLRAYLFAAAVANKPVADLVAWAANPHHKDPLAILQGAHTQLYEELNAERQEDPRTSGGVWMGVRQVVGPWVLNRALHQMCSPPTGRGLDLRSFIGQHGSLYVIGGSRRTRSAVPLLTALAEEFILAAEALAGDYPHERLDPPASVVLDELTNATPIPQLPSLLSQVAGNGISIHWAAQSMALLEGTYGPVGARSVIGNTTALSVWGGIPDPATLEMLSTLMGQRQQVRTQYQQDGVLSPSRTSVGTEWVPILRAGEIRQIPRGQVLLVYRHLGAILAHTTPLSHRRDATQILADANTLRANTASVDTAGYATTAATTASIARDR